MSKLIIPKHIAIIMDGNGRWAKRRGMPRNAGHKAGIKAIEKTIEGALSLGVKHLTFYAFSTENWKRSKEEIDGIFALIRDYLKDNPVFFKEKNICIKHIGNITPFPNDLKQQLSKSEQNTLKNDKLILTFALNYGGRDEIVRAVNKIINSGKMEINYKDIEQNLDTYFLPEPDLVIRTSGEKRLSNFMMLQMAYSELYFPKLYWPDFSGKQLLKAVKIYNKRERRFGGISQ